MTKIFLTICFCFILTNLFATEPDNKVKFEIKPNVFDSTVTFSFYIPKGDTVSLVIVDRWLQTIVTIIPLKYYTAGRHDTTCNLSFLEPKKYLCQLGVGRTTVHYNREGIRRVAETTVQELLTRRTTKGNKKRDNFTDTTQHYFDIKKK